MATQTKQTAADDAAIDVTRASKGFFRKTSKVIVDTAIIGRYYVRICGKSVFRKDSICFSWLGKIHFNKEYFKKLSDSRYRKMFVQWLQEKLLFLRDRGSYTLKEFKLNPGAIRNILQKLPLPGGSDAQSSDKAALLDQLSNEISKSLPAEEEDTLTILNLDEYLDRINDKK